MKRSDLIRLIRERHGALSNAEAQAILDAMLKGIEESLARDEEVRINALGTFSTSKRRRRGSRDATLKTGKRPVYRKGATFSPAISLLESLNKGHD